MSGNYIDTNLPDLPGVYSQETAVIPTTIPPSPGGIVALAVTHDWGPSDEPKLLARFDEWETIFGTDVSPGRIAVQGALTGEGLEGLGGANAVLVQRLVGDDGAASTVTLKNPGTTNCLSVTGKYDGTRGNRFKVTATPIVGGVQTIIILDGTSELEEYTFHIAGAGALAGLAAAVNAVSPNVTLGVVLEGTTGLAAGTFTLIGGDDGGTLTGANWIDGANDFNNFDFAVFAPFDLPWSSDVGDTAIVAAVDALVAWCQSENDAGHRFTLVVGGALDEIVADAVARASSISNPNVITIGGPGVNDDTYGALSTSQLAPRYAGIRAQRGETEATHFARLAGTTPRPKAAGGQLTLADQETMAAGGVVSLQRDRYALAPTRVVKDVNTWAPIAGSADAISRPRSIYGNPKFMLAMQRFQSDCEAELEVEMIGRTVVNDSTRNAAAARVLRQAKLREVSGAFQPGTIVSVVPGSDSDEFIKLKVQIAFGRALAQLFIQSAVR